MRLNTMMLEVHKKSCTRKGQKKEGEKKQVIFYPELGSVFCIVTIITMIIIIIKTINM